MARLVGGVVGAVVGYYVGGPSGASYGWAIGSTIGGAFEPNAKISGPRLEDLSIPGTQYGQPIPYLLGHVRTAGQVWWSSQKREVGTTTTQGKGGGTDSTTYTYEIDLLIGLCDNEAGAVTRIWNNGKLVYTALPDSDDASLVASQASELWHRITFYSGAADQMPDSTYEAAVGVGKAPAYRGRASIFIEALQLGNSGQMLNLNFEVTRIGKAVQNRTTKLGAYVHPLNPPVTDPMPLQFSTIAQLGTDIVTHVGGTHTSYELIGSYTPIPGQPPTPIYGYVTTWYGSILSFPMAGGAGTRKGAGNFQTFRIAAEVTPNRAQDITWLSGGINQSDVPASIVEIFTTNLSTNSQGSSYTFNALDYLRYGNGTVVDPVTGQPDPAGVTVLAFQQPTASQPQVGSASADRIGRAAFRDGELVYQRIPTVNSGGPIAPDADDYKLLSNFGSKSVVLPALDYIVLTPNKVWGYLAGGSQTFKLFELDRSGLTLLNTYGADTFISVPPFDNSPVSGASGFLFLANDSDVPYMLSATGDVGGLSRQKLFRWGLADQSWILVSIVPPMDTGPFQPYQSTLIGESIFGITRAPGSNEISLWVSQSTVGIAEETIQYGVEALCLRAGLSADQFDASALAAIEKPLRGFAITQIGGTRAALDILAAAYFFEMALWDKIYFIPRGSAPVVRIPYTDLGTSDQDGASVDLFSLKRDSGLEIPMRVAVSYMNIDNDYQTDTQNSERYYEGDDGTISPVSMALVFTAGEAKGIAVTMVLDQTVAGMGTCDITVQRKYARLTPTDVIEVEDRDGSIYRTRIVKRTDAGAVLTFGLVIDDETVLTDTGITTTVYSPTVIVNGPASTDLELLDIPALRDADATPGLYVAASGSSAAWPGAAVLESSDDVNFSQIATVQNRSVIAQAVNALALWTGGSVVDNTNFLLVNVPSGQQLTSTTRAALLVNNTINSMLVGSEIVRFLTATLLSAGSYRLSGFIRGCRGTEWAMSSHVAGERAILLDPGALRRITDQTADIGVPRFWKGVTMGRQVSTADEFPFTDVGVSIKPFSPVDLRLSATANGDCTLMWKRRTRLSCNFTGALGITVPLGETAELYDVEFVDGSGLIKRMMRVATPTCVYSGAQQAVDFGARQTTLRVNIYQVSPSAGRGYPLSATRSTGFAPGAFTHTITLGGTFATGIPLTILSGANTIASYITQTSDVDLSGIAAALATLIDATADYSAVSTGVAISVTGPIDQNFVLRAVVSGNAQIDVYRAQTYAAVGPGTAYWASIFVNSPDGSGNFPVGVSFGVSVERPQGQQMGSISATTTVPSSRDLVYRGLNTAFTNSAASSALRAQGFGVVVRSDTDTFDLYGPVGMTAINLVLSSSPSYSINYTLHDAGSAAVTSERQEIWAMEVTGAPATGDIFTIGYHATYSYTAVSGDDALAIANALGALINADTHYFAVGDGHGGLTITGRQPYSADGYPVGTVTRAITATVS